MQAGGNVHVQPLLHTGLMALGSTTTAASLVIKAIASEKCLLGIRTRCEWSMAVMQCRVSVIAQGSSMLHRLLEGSALSVSNQQELHR